MPRAEFSPQLRDDAEAAGMVATLGDFDVGHVARRGQDSRSRFGVKIIWEVRDGAIPFVFAETSAALASVTLRARRFRIRPRVSRFRPRGQNAEGRIMGDGFSCCDTR